MSDSDMTREIDLAGQVAIVTGGGRGIRRAIALSLAKAGTAVAVVARTAEQVAETASLIEGAGGQAVAIPADVTDAQAVWQMAAEVEGRLGPVDLLVNNAGPPGPSGPVWEFDPDEWWRCVDVNLRGPFLCCRTLLPSMVARGRGRIVNTASGGGFDLGPMPPHAPSASAPSFASRRTRPPRPGTGDLVSFRSIRALCVRQ